MALSSADNLCRTCLRQGGLLKSIFTIYEGFDVMISFADIINGYTTSLVQIAKEDGLPDMICSFCSNKVSEFYKFKTSIEKNEQILKSRSTNLNVTVKEEKLDFNDSFQESNVNCNKNVAENADETTIKQENLCKEEEEDNEYKIVNIDGLMHHDDVNSSNKEGQEDFLALQKMLNHEVKIDDPDENDYEMLSLDNSTTSFESDEEEAMQEVVNEASDTEDDLAEKNENGKPSRSKRKYASAFKKFQEWRNTENVDSLSEDVLLSYFNELTKTLKPNSLWTQYSMLRQTLIANYDVDISQYHKLRAGLKNKSQAYKPKKLKTLTMEEVDKFIKKAPDETYLFTKMPRKHISLKPKGKLKNWDPKSMMKAIVSVRGKKMGLRKAVNLYQVPQTTLQRFVISDKTPEECVNLKVGRKSVLPAELETELVNYLIEMDDRFYGLRRDDVKRLAYQLAVRNNISHPFINETAGRAWFDLFTRRHCKKFTTHKPIGTSFSRANGFNKEAVDKFFHTLQAEYDKHPYTADRVFNVDETGLTVVQSKIPHVIGLKGKRQVGAITSGERGSLVTVVCCMSAGGIFVPPMMIFPRKNMSDTLMRGAPSGSIGRCHVSGWIQTELFTEWFNHFLQKTRPSEESPVLLILDGHNTHTRNLAIIDLARQNHVTIVSIPPNTSNKIQPLDKTFMGPLKTHYSEYVRQFLRYNERPVGPYDIAELFGRAYLQCQTGIIAANGFKVTGIYPFDRTVFQDVDFLASDSGMPIPEIKTSSSSFSLPVQSESSISPQVNDSYCPSVLAQDAGISYPYRPSDIDLREAGTSNLTAPIVSPRDIMPVPAPKRKRSNRGKKPSSAAVITNSPYKLELQEALDKPTKGLPKRKGKKEQSKLCKRKVYSKTFSDESIYSRESVMEIPVGSTPPAEDDALCIFCGIAFSNDVRGKLWIRCLLCDLWCHSLCSGAKSEHYICDFCK